MTSCMLESSLIDGRNSRTESRIRRKVYVRFGGGTCHTYWVTVPTLPFSNILAGSVGFFTKAGLLGGGAALLGVLGLVGGATL